MRTRERWANVDPYDTTGRHQAPGGPSNGRGYVALTVPQATIANATGITYMVRHPIRMWAHPIDRMVALTTESEGLRFYLYMTPAEADRLAAVLTTSVHTARLAGAQ